MTLDQIDYRAVFEAIEETRKVTYELGVFIQLGDLKSGDKSNKLRELYCKLTDLTVELLDVKYKLYDENE